MMVYVVHVESHTDCYKRGDSDFSISGVFISKEKAYDHAIEALDPVEAIFDNCDEKLLKEYQKCATNIEKYDFIHDNFNEIFGEAEYTTKPSHEICVVTEFELL